MKANNSFFTAPQEFYQSYREDGFAIEPDVFSEQECENIIANAKELSSYQSGNVRPAMQIQNENKSFVDNMQNAKIVSIMQQLIGGEISCIQTEFFYCKPKTPGFSAHQDNFFVRAPEDAFASAWIALTDVTPEKGGLIVWKGSQKAGFLSVEDKDITEHPDQDPNANKTTCLVPDTYPAISPSVKKGSVLFIHGNLVHASHQNKSDDWRYVLLCTYIRKGEQFRPGRYAERTAIELTQPPFIHTR